METLRIKGSCPRGGSKQYVDEAGNLRAGRLQIYINTAIFMGCKKLQFDDTLIMIKAPKIQDNV